MRNRKSPQSVLTRSGFTLVEILIVIGIIGLLVATLVVAIGPSLESARINAVRTTIAKIDAAIQARVEAINSSEAVERAAKRLASAASISQAQAEFIIKKNAIRQALPQRVEDFRGFDRATGGSDNTTLPGSFTASDSDFCEPLFISLTEVSSIELLPGGPSLSLPLLDIDTINPSHVGDTDNDDNQEFIDEWNQPLRFYLWPTSLIRPGGGDISQAEFNAASILISGMEPFSGNTLAQSTTTHSLNNDSSNPTGLLNNAFSSTRTISGGLLTVTIEPFNQANYHAAGTFHTPLLVSSGPDQELGLEEPDDGTAANRLALPTDSDSGTAGVQPDLDVLSDNITNRQQ